MYYRYELTFDGEPQQVGFLHGLDEALAHCNMRPSHRLYLYDLFKSLRSPNCEGQVEFWFSEKGRRVFNRHIDILCAAIEQLQNPWGVIERKTDGFPGRKIVYQDELQIAVQR